MTALYVGGMGARGKNFYNDLARRYGYEKEAVDIQDLYLDGKKDEAAAHVPAEWLELSNLVGPAQLRQGAPRRLQGGRGHGAVVNPVARPRRHDRAAARARRRRDERAMVERPRADESERWPERPRAEDAVSETMTTRPASSPRAGSRCAPRSRRTSTSGREVGAAVAVYHRGRTVVSTDRGVLRRGGDPPVHRRHLAARVLAPRRASPRIAVAMCVSAACSTTTRRSPTYWPEFGAAGKERSHRRPAAVAPGRADRDRRRGHARRRARLERRWRRGWPTPGPDLGARHRRTATTP